MKILYLGKFDKFYRTENYVAHALAKAHVRIRKVSINRIQTLSQAKEITRRENVDVVLFSKASRPWVKDHIVWCRDNRITTACWLWDLYWGYRPSRPPQFRADYLFTTDGGHVDRWREIKANHYTLRQGIHANDAVWVGPREYKHDVAFVGSPKSYRERKKLVHRLQSVFGERLVIHRNRRGLALNEALAEVKVVVGDSYNTPNYWSNRIYEITGRGGFLLHPATVGLDSEYTRGEHFVEYERNNFARLKELIEFYVENDEERERIRQTGFLHTKTHYTYDYRVAELLEVLLRDTAVSDRDPSLLSLRSES